MWYSSPLSRVSGRGRVMSLPPQLPTQANAGAGAHAPACSSSGCLHQVADRSHPSPMPAAQHHRPSSTHPMAACNERIVSLVSTAIMQAKKICQPRDCRAARAGVEQGLKGTGCGEQLERTRA